MTTIKLKINVVRFHGKGNMASTVMRVYRVLKIEISVIITVIPVLRSTNIIGGALDAEM
jgi:hypothetical protein